MSQPPVSGGSLKGLQSSAAFLVTTEVPKSIFQVFPCCRSALIWVLGWHSHSLCRAATGPLESKVLGRLVDPSCSPLVFDLLGRWQRDRDVIGTIAAWCFMVAGSPAAAWRGGSCSPVAQLTRVDPASLCKLNSDGARFWVVLSSHLPRGCGQCAAGHGEGAAACCRGDLVLAEWSRDGAGCGVGDSSPVKRLLGCLA